MGAKFDALKPKHIDFIEQQPLYFVSTAPDEGRINLSPKGMDSLRVISPTQVIWLNYTGSGNETAAHLLENSRMTIMFCSFSGNPLILRLYGHATLIKPGDDNWESTLHHFPDSKGARQVIDMKIELVHTSCGFGVPLMSYQGQREQLTQWIDKKGDEGIHAYQQRNNVVSLDGKPTDIKPE